MRVILLSLLFATSLVAPSALAQEPPAAIKGSQPKKPSRPAEPPPAQEAADTELPTSAPLRSKAMDLKRKTQDITEQVTRLQARIGEGADITGKWANTAKIFVKFSEEAAAVELDCSVQSQKLKQAKDRGLSDFMIGTLSKRTKECEVEVGQLQVAVRNYERIVAGVSEAVNRVDQEVKMHGEQVEELSRQRKVYETQLSFDKVLDDAQNKLIKFDPKNKRLLSN